MPETEPLIKILFAIVSFISERWLALIIFASLFAWAMILYRKFHAKSNIYVKTVPKEAKFLSLQCKRWVQYVNQVKVAISLSVFTALIMYLAIDLNNAIISATKGVESTIQAGSNIAIIEAMVFIFLFTIKFRTLWDASSVHKDMKNSNL